MRYKKIAEVTNVVTGGTPSTSKPEYWDGGTIPWLQSGCCQNCEVTFAEKHITQSGYDNSSTKMMVPNTVMIALTGATAGKVGYLTFEACGNQSITGILPSPSINSRFLFYYLLSKREHILADCIGGAQPHISQGYVKDILIPDISLEEQNRIVDELECISLILNKRQEEIKLFDNLIKARFVELFGDPIINSEKLPTMPMTDVCDIIDGDRGKNYPTADEFSDEGYCLFLNAKNVTASGFNFDNCMFVSKEKDEALRKGKLSRGDVVLTTRGTLGNLAFYTDEIPFENIRINSGMVILRMKQDLIDEIYFIEQFKMQLDDIKEKIASGSAQPQLPISTMNKIQVLIPDIERQKVFSEFIKQVDKSKVAIQKSLDEARLLFDSLMQEYFG